ncbi:MAG: alkaline phosphatase family protein [Luteitalea sp.]|nr:alkaline phosphatase family protein [Luteitalea sp.]
MPRTVVINVVGLTPRLLQSVAPQLARWGETASVARVRSAFPAVTSTAQADYLTGQYPEVHGIVGNGWYFRDDCEVRFWRQSNKLVQAPKVWEAARAVDPSFTCANLFWWFNMYSTADYAVTPRPMYPADGRKLPDVYTTPAGLRDELQDSLGTFPLFDFWGPKTSIKSSQWIAAAAKQVEEKFTPTLTLIYVPHLDYQLQRVGPADSTIAADVQQVDELCADLISYYESRETQVIIVSEYGLCEVSSPIHLNRVLREHGLIAVRQELGCELLDPGASAAFAVADHQVAHVYVNDPARLDEVRALLDKTDGVDEVLDAHHKEAHRVAHERCGDLVAIASPNAWFTYYYWLDDNRAPDFARTVDIHRKPGYDPAELFIDPAIRTPTLRIGWKLAKKSLGFRTLLDVIPLDATLVKGSHGRRTDGSDDGPLLMTRQRHLLPADVIDSVDVYAIILSHLTPDSHSTHVPARLRWVGTLAHGKLIPDS